MKPYHLAAICLALVTATHTAGTGADTKQWTATPAPAGKSTPGPDDRTSFDLEGDPGTVFQDKLSVVNTGDTARSLDVRADGSWISLAARTVKIPARTRADVPFAVAVPADAAPGAHPGALVVSGEGRQVRVPLAVRVAGAALPALAVEHVRVSREGGGAVIRYALVNRGNTALAPRLDIRADGLFGTVLRRTATGVPARLAPGRSVRLAERWADAPRLDSVRVRLTATAPGGARATASGSYTPLPWLFPALGGLAAVLAAAVLLLVRRSRRARSAGAAA
ncbi:hypothetical protein ACFY1P_28895 [Streptomyces sp. NPDC001407]|uniref:COG1470 family protein n=1 Tax=unclassified Streptomyces TaxID=2593676 RepID=UPI00369974AC